MGSAVGDDRWANKGIASVSNWVKLWSMWHYQHFNFWQSFHHNIACTNPMNDSEPKVGGICSKMAVWLTLVDIAATGANSEKPAVSKRIRPCLRESNRWSTTKTDFTTTHHQRPKTILVLASKYIQRQWWNRGCEWLNKITHGGTKAWIRYISHMKEIINVCHMEPRVSIGSLRASWSDSKISLEMSLKTNAVMSWMQGLKKNEHSNS